MEKSIYINCDKCLFSKNGWYAVLLSATVLAGISLILNFSLIITELSSYLILSMCSLVAAISIFKLYKEQEQNYIYINHDEIWFKQQMQSETVCLKFTKLDYFETRFSEIIFSTKEEEKVVLKLNKIADEKKRWELKEFLRNHIPQIRDNKVSLLKSA
ncbi:hypothetical protein I5M32_06525 [Pedobacter sp. SD-b]|uniref:PH domain-containing protein n=1 Tax=Pedobacter segetis TaxID=2793069 RepID=A0ABS1BK71_9SPHI|nr:hypothetical protein [Pedobacter segetis]MBK0382614.1 hypothetical protein [Pedobacter segetis]